MSDTQRATRGAPDFTQPHAKDTRLNATDTELAQGVPHEAARRSRRYVATDASGKHATAAEFRRLMIEAELAAMGAPKLSVIKSRLARSRRKAKRVATRPGTLERFAAKLPSEKA